MNELGSIVGNTFTAFKAGKGTIKVTSGKATTTVDIQVYDNSPQIFKDVKNDYWAREQIKFLVERKVVTGYPDGNFKPAAKISRRHAALMMVRAMDLDTINITNPNFKDVPTTDQDYPQIAAAANAGLINGKEIGKFSPEDLMTRAEMSTILQRAYKLPNTEKSYFPDVPKDQWAYDSINAVAAAKISEGYPDGTYRHYNEVTRAEFSAFLFNSLKR